jgi:hypothetical protein
MGGASCFLLLFSEICINAKIIVDLTTAIEEIVR